ncbi:MAG: hypothetical protein ACAI38_20865 [Myxococcota bacterium]
MCFGLGRVLAVIDARYDLTVVKADRADVVMGAGGGESDEQYLAAEDQPDGN